MKANKTSGNLAQKYLLKKTPGSRIKRETKHNQDQGFQKTKDNQDQGLKKHSTRIKECRENDLIDSKYGFDRLTTGEKTAYLINMHACEVPAFSCIF